MQQRLFTHLVLCYRVRAFFVYVFSMKFAQSQSTLWENKSEPKNRAAVEKQSGDVTEPTGLSRESSGCLLEKLLVEV